MGQITGELRYHLENQQARKTLPNHLIPPMSFPRFQFFGSVCSLTNHGFVVLSGPTRLTSNIANRAMQLHSTDN